MHARVIAGHYQLDKMDAGIQTFRSSIVPEAWQQQGFKGLIGLLDRSTGKAMSISFWETEADLQRAAATGFLQEQIDKVAPLLASGPVIEVYEVTTRGLELRFGSSGV